MLIAAVAVMASCGAGYWTAGYRDGYTYYDPFYYSNCPRHYTYGYLDCNRCHW